MAKRRQGPPTAPERRYKVFVSSTYLDNQTRRAVVEDAILAAEMFPVGMERFTAETQPTVAACLKLVRDADVFVGIVAWRYGWIPKGRARSITELEYREARKAGKPCFMFVFDPDLPVNPSQDFDDGPDKWEKQAKLERFKAFFGEHQKPGRFRDDTLGTRVVVALNRWLRANEAPTTAAAPRRKSPKAPKNDGAAGALAAYLTKAERRYATLPIVGFESRLRVAIDVDELYVPLTGLVASGDSGEAIFADAEDAEKRLRERGGASEIALVAAFDEAERCGRRGLVILGDPGSGKTTQLKRMLLSCVREGSRSLGLPDGFVPILVPLRNLRDAARGLEALIEAEVADIEPATAGGRLGRKLLDRGSLLLLLDGLDEVADPAHREQVTRAIDRAVTEHPSCRFVVTSRFAGYTREARLGTGSFLELHLRPLTFEQAEQFVRNWYRSVERGLASDPNEGEVVAAAQTQELLARLASPDFRARRVFELTRNPLLLANLCLVHRDRGKLPRGRAQLYDECIDVLLARWREGKQLAVTVPADAARRVLQPAALWLHREEGRTRALVDELAPVIDPALGKLQWKGGSAREFLRTIRDESGLLTGWDQQHYGFMHLGFQEYLAAREIRARAFQDPKVLAELASHFGESWWQEVILVLLALHDPSLFEPFMREVVKLPAFAEHTDLVDACLDDSAEISAAPFVELLRVIPGNKSRLWKRQLHALVLLERVAPDELAGLGAVLRQHPSPAIQARLRVTAGAARHAMAVAEQAGYQLARIRGGVFRMGSPRVERERFEDEEPQHEVSVPSFWLGRHTVTNEQYGAYLREKPNVSEPRFWADRRFNQARQPVVGLTWDEAQAYAKWAGLRLPTEAEWEYACRAGTTTRYSSGDSEADLDRVGWYSENSGGALHPVGEKEPNAFGLYDMHGNVWEWVEDEWHSDYDGAPTDERAWIGNRRVAPRVNRGGSFANSAGFARAACRYFAQPSRRYERLGFRLARSDP